MFLGIDWLSALIKISFQIVFAIVTALPFKIAWNCVAPAYLSFLPEVYHSIPYSHMIAIILVFSFVGEQINKITPKIVSVNQENKSG